MISNQPLLIAVVDVPQNFSSGDYYYRTYSPGLAMSREENVFVVSISRLHPKLDEVVKHSDILILNDICDSDMLPVIAERKRLGIPTFFEIADDMNGLQPWNPVYNFYKNEENIRLIYKLANYCDGLQFSVPELQKLYGTLNTNKRVFTNQLISVSSIKEKQYDNNLTIGWGGSHGHLDDINTVVKPLIDWVLSRSDVKLHLMCSKPIFDLFNSMPKNRIRYFSTGSIDDYYNFLSTIDVGIAPLNDTPFNRSRSDVKFLEYAVSGVVPVLADIAPYKDTVINGRTGFLYKNVLELTKKLNYLANNREIIKNVSKQARDYVISCRHQVDHNTERLSFYLKDLKTRNKSADLFNKWSCFPGALLEGRFLILSNTEFEKQLFEGLILMQEPEKNSHAVKCFKKGSNIEPDNYLPYLYQSQISKDPVSVLLKAIHIQPHSIKAYILLGDQYARLGKIIEAFNTYNKAATIFSEYDIPFSRSGDLLMRLGKEKEAKYLYKMAAEKRFTLP